KKYAHRLLHIFGMRSEKALGLLNQIVGIKVLGNLDAFIRENMLDSKDTEEEFLKLKEHADTLLEAKRNIDKASKKIELLQPIQVSTQSIRQIEEEKDTLQHLQTIGASWFAEKHIQFLQLELQKQSHRLQVQQEKLQQTKEALGKGREEEKEIELSLRMDQVEQRIVDIKQLIQIAEKEKEKALKKHDEYKNLAESLGYAGSPTEEEFHKNYRHIQELRRKEENHLSQLEEELYQSRKELDMAKDFFKTGLQELETLLKQKNNISGRVAEIRRELLQHLQAEAWEVPFIGELLRVKEQEKHWQAAIERLLHNFALRLLVPEKYYYAANDYINRTNLRGRIIFHKFFSGQKYSHNTHLKSVDGFLYQKLEFKQDSLYTAWVEDKILQQFDYYCSDDLDEFTKYKKAITQNGLIKSADRHEKDDRKTSLQVNSYVLGWDNKEKIAWWREKLRVSEKEITTLQNKFDAIVSKKQQLEARLTHIQHISIFTDFQEIHWQAYVKEIDELQEDQNRLEQSNQKNQELRKSLQKLQQRIDELEAEKDAQLREITRVQTSMEAMQLEHSKQEVFLQEREKYSQEEKDLFAKELVKFVSGLEFANFEDRIRQAQSYLHERTQILQQRWHSTRNKLTTQITRFKRPASEILQEFPDWSSDVHTLPDNVDYADEYLVLLNRLQREGLPQFQKKFEIYLNDTMIHKIANFNQELEDWREGIDADIHSLNQSLRGINFKSNPETYIQLKYSNSQNQNTKDFRQALRNTFPDMSVWNRKENDFEFKKTHFETNIIPLLQKLYENEGWRREVLDVRNWHSYYAAEYYRETGLAMKTYTEMGKLSGGEKAQLTYTILGSAIAHQFGIHQEGVGSNSFRFIAVDESFSNQDEEKATYLMELCKQLHLQLLVVTPSDKLSIVEPYISYVHYVHRVGNKESILYDMPILVFQAEQEKRRAEV
ncbi:MAG: SbcC/MukB-like Walker B domain-containing protein, partial [Spirochaetota bacterium]